MALIRWQPFQEMSALRRQMDDMFDELMGNENQLVNWKPAVEMQDTDENLILRAELPGIDTKDIDIQVMREAVVISGENRHEHKTEGKGFIRSEFRYGKFQRMIPLPVPIKNDEAQAKFEHGVLTLTLPKAAEARRTVVKLNLADGNASNPQINAQPAGSNN